MAAVAAAAHGSRALDTSRGDRSNANRLLEDRWSRTGLTAGPGHMRDRLLPVGARARLVTAPLVNG